MTPHPGYKVTIEPGFDVPWELTVRNQVTGKADVYSFDTEIEALGYLGELDAVQDVNVTLRKNSEGWEGSLEAQPQPNSAFAADGTITVASGVQYRRIDGKWLYTMEGYPFSTHGRPVASDDDIELLDTIEQVLHGRTRRRVDGPFNHNEVDDLVARIRGGIAKIDALDKIADKVVFNGGRYDGATLAELEPSAGKSTEIQDDLRAALDLLGVFRRASHYLAEVLINAGMVEPEDSPIIDIAIDPNHIGATPEWVFEQDA